MTAGDDPDEVSTAAVSTTAVSVVIPCHSLERWPQLVAAVESVRAQTPRPVEIVVSVDHNDALLDRARRELTGATVLANRYSPGASGTRNTGILHTGTPLVALLDDDAQAHPGWLAGLLTPLAQPEVIGTCGRIVPSWPGAQPAWYPDEFLWAVAATTGLPSTPTRVRNGWAVNMAMRRDAFDLAGGFRLDFGKRGNRSRPEDTELCLRMSRTTGGEWTYVPDAVVEHMVPPQRTTLRYLIARCYHEGRGKIALARLAGGADGLDTERAYVRSTLPQAFLRNLGAALRGRGLAHAATAGALLTGTASAALGALVELVVGRREPAQRGPQGEPVTDGGIRG